MSKGAWRYRLGCWADARWAMLVYARLKGPDRHPVLFYIGTVPLTTWLTRPLDALSSVRAHVAGWRRYQGPGRRP